MTITVTSVLDKLMSGVLDPAKYTASERTILVKLISSKTFDSEEIFPEDLTVTEQNLKMLFDSIPGTKGFDRERYAKYGADWDRSAPPKREPLSSEKMDRFYHFFCYADDPRKEIEHNLPAALRKMLSGSVNRDDFSMCEYVCLVFIMRQKNSRMETSISRMDAENDLALSKLAVALAHQEHGYDYYLNGGLFNG